MLKFDYSLRKLSTGFTLAARVTRTPIVTKAMMNVISNDSIAICIPNGIW